MFKTEEGAVVGSIDVAALEADEAEESDGGKESDGGDDLASLKKAELVDLAEAKGIDTSGKKKDDLRAELESRDN